MPNPDTKPKDYSQEDLSAQLSYKLCNVELRTWPFSHFYLDNVFPVGFYKQILQGMPPPEGYSGVKDRYNGRKFATEPDLSKFDFMLTPNFLRNIVYIFKNDFNRRFPSGNFRPKMDLRLIMDGENYSIGPHTDARWKVVSLLFYLPPDSRFSPLGTSIYTPKDPTFTCPGGPHHKFENFQRVYTAPFRPNSVLGFFKTDYSFHGVEPITIPCRRDLLLWNLYDASEMK